MRKILLAGIAALALVNTGAHAEEQHWETVHYDATIGNPVVGLTIDSCPDLCFGGGTLAAPGYEPTRVVVTDDNFEGVKITVGQDFDGDSFSGEAGEPRVEGCGGSLALNTSTVPFDPNREIAVFVDAISDECIGGFGTSGQIDLYVEIPDEV